jgi:hypothetical protein
MADEKIHKTLSVKEDYNTAMMLNKTRTLAFQGAQLELLSDINKLLVEYLQAPDYEALQGLATLEAGKPGPAAKHLQRSVQICDRLIQPGGAIAALSAATPVETLALTGSQSVLGSTAVASFPIRPVAQHYLELLGAGSPSAHADRAPLPATDP